MKTVKKTIKIGMILDHEFPPDMRVENEIIALKKSGFDVYILSLNFGSKPAIDDFHGARVIRIKAKKYLIKKMKALTNTIFNFYPYYLARYISKFIKKYQIDVLHVHDLYLASSGIIANRKFNLVTVLDLHENYPEVIKTYTWANKGIGKYLISPKKWKKLERDYLEKYNKIIVLSDNFRNELLKEYKFLCEDSFIIYPNVPNVNKLLTYPIENVLDKKDDFYIFYFGKIGQRRGIFETFEALRILIKTSKNIKLLLIGPVDKNDKIKFNNYLKDDEIKNNIIYIPWIDMSKFPSYCSISDVCMSPIIKNKQHESGVANKIFQYMLYEKPLLVSNCIPQQKIIEEEECGLVFKSGDSINFKDKIIELYKNEKLRKEMGENGKIAVMKKYNLEVASKNIIRFYDGIKNNNK